jgi:endonuclease/exonuclease/phosphatase family metal-dependent hydrolase
MKLMTVLLLMTVESLAQIAPIAEARKAKSGSVVTIAGRITAAKEFGDLSFVQDRTGGIPVYSADLAMSVGRGDSVVVAGKLSKFNGLLEIIPDSVWKIPTGTKEILPKDIEPRRAKDHEAELVRITGLVLKPPGHFFYPQRAGLTLKGADSLHYWIDGDTDLPGYSIPFGPVSITGVIGRYRDQFQLLPRSTEDIPGLTRTSTKRNEHSLTVMNWNVEFFGATREKYGSEYGPADESRQVDNVAHLLNTILPDVVALQEVSDDSAFGDLLNKLPGYEGRCSSRYSYSHDTSEDFPPQKVCYVYKSSSVRVVREKILFRKLYDDALSSQSYLLDNAPGGASSVFSSGRLPYLIEADVTVDGKTDRIVFVNLHGKSGATSEDYIRRVFDARILKDSLDRYYTNRKLLILGDLNDDLDISIADARESPYQQFVHDPAYTCVSKALSDNDWYSTISFDDVIDHQVLSTPLAESFMEGSTRIVNPFGMIERYAETTSDHLPVVSEFDLRKVVTNVADREFVSVFPNPARDLVNILCPGYFEYRLISSSGALVCHGSGFDETSFSAQVAGLYFLVIRKGLISQALSIYISY